MPYANSYVYLRAEGTLGAVSEVDIFTMGWKIALSTGTEPGTSALVDFLEAVEAPLKAFHGSTSLNSSSAAILRSASAAVIGTDGKYTGAGLQATTRVDWTEPGPGFGTAVHPWSTAMCMTHRTVRSRGRGSHGRVFWPCLTLPVSPITGGWPTSTVPTIAGEYADLIGAINAAAASELPANLGVCVMSNRGTGTTAQVTYVQVGNKPDRQERRESALLENYEDAPV